MVDRFQRTIRRLAEFFKDQWFDRSRNVRTSGEVMLDSVGVPSEELQDSEPYQPARSAHTRRALSEMPVRDVSDFSYVDLGSGKGRTLFVAAELPFKQITGVEFSRRLHDQACANIRSFRFWKPGCRNITSVYGNAKDFAFPDSNLVLYLFNPFGPATMKHVFDNLEASLRLHPRHVIVVLMWPRPGGGDLVAAVKGMHLIRETKRYQIFEAHAPQSPTQTPDRAL